MTRISFEGWQWNSLKHLDPKTSNPRGIVFFGVFSTFPTPAPPCSHPPMPDPLTRDLMTWLAEDWLRDLDAGELTLDHLRYSPALPQLEEFQARAVAQGEAVPRPVEDLLRRLASARPLP